MPEYIDRKVIEDAMEHLMNKYSKAYTNNQFSKDCLRYIQKKLRATPTADVVPVKHGSWISHYYSGTTVAEGVVSSCCDMWNNRKTDYCPYCGAKMDRGDGDAAD